MEILRVYLLPLILAVAAVLLLAVETRALQLEMAGRRPRWSRFIRRMLGAVCIAAIAFMLHFGSSPPTREVAVEVVHRQFYYWIWVLALVLFTVMLAMWDAIDSVRAIKHHLEVVERDELASLQEQIRKRGRTSR